MLMIGHRGAAGLEPENTLLSFEKALFFGVDAIELDVFITKDQKVVVIHDDTLNRTTNGNGYVSESIYGDIKKLDAGKGQTIPLLEQVLDLVNKRCIVNIELKGENTPKYVAEIINSYLALGWDHELFIITSSNEFLLKEFQQLSPNITLGLIYSGIPLVLADIGKHLGVNILCLDREFINQKFINDAHKKNIRVFVWTVDSIQEINKCKLLGVDGVISNFPNLV